MTSPTADDLANWLLAQHDGRHVFKPLTADLAGRDEAYLYDVQDRLNARRMARGSTVAGYKIGLTTPVMQALCHGDHPIAGVMFADMQRAAPTTVRAADFVRLGIESELAVRLGRPLPAKAGPISRDDVAASIVEVAAAFELIEDRAADYSTVDWRSMAADNSWHAGLVLGAAAPATATDLDGGLAGQLEIDGVENANGSTRDVLGHPYDAVAWLANHLHARGKNLEVGQWISTGSIVPIRHATPGQRYRFTIAGLPPVEITIA